MLHYGALMHCCRVDFHTQTGLAGAKASLEAQQLTEAVGTVFDLQTGTLHAPALVMYKTSGQDSGHVLLR